MGKDERNDASEEGGGGRGRKGKWPPAVNGPLPAGLVSDRRRIESSSTPVEALKRGRTREVSIT